MTVATINIEIYCATCGAGLCGDTEFAETYSRHEPSFRVAACSHCMEVARDEGRDEGYDQGRKEGYDEGFEHGKAE